MEQKLQNQVQVFAVLNDDWKRTLKLSICKDIKDFKKFYKEYENDLS